MEDSEEARPSTQAQPTLQEVLPTVQDVQPIVQESKTTVQEAQPMAQVVPALDTSGSAPTEPPPKKRKAQGPYPWSQSSHQVEEIYKELQELRKYHTCNSTWPTVGYSCETRDLQRGQLTPTQQ